MLLYVSSGKQPHNYGKSPLLIGKSTISMAIFNSFVKLPEGIYIVLCHASPFKDDVQNRKEKHINPYLQHL
jgi:hypothetical protein